MIDKQKGGVRVRNSRQATTHPPHPGHQQEAGRTDRSVPSGDVTARTPRSRDEVIADLLRSRPTLSLRQKDRLRALLAPFARTRTTCSEGADAA